MCDLRYLLSPTHNKMVGYSVAKKPTETPTNTAYAARAMGAKLSFAFTLLTYEAVNPVTPISYYLPVDPISPPSEVD